MIRNKLKKFVVGLMTVTTMVSSMFLMPSGVAKVGAASPHYGNDWMKHIASKTSLARLSIPGTHNSCSYNTSGLASRVSKCQNKTLNEQLNMGVRFLDIRCKFNSDGFAIHHGDDYLNMNFNQVLNECYKFLNSNSKECIIMSVKEEVSNSKGNSFQDQFKKYINNNSNKWYLGSSIPTLGDVRGKIVLVRRFRGNLGIDASSWKDDATFSYGNVYVQDKYTLDDASKKMSEVDKFFKQVPNHKNQLCINFTSATMYSSTFKQIWNYITFDSVEDLAKEVNGKLKNYSFKSKTCYGVVAMDFVNSDLCKKIYDTNTF